jgi:hypothetical protein
LRGIWNYLIVKPVNGLKILLRAIWRYLIVKPVSWLRVLFHHFMTKPITVWGVLWRYIVLAVILFLPLNPLFGQYWHDDHYDFDISRTLIATLLISAVILGVFLAGRFALRNRVPFRQARTQS